MIPRTKSRISLKNNLVKAISLKMSRKVNRVINHKIAKTRIRKIRMSKVTNLKRMTLRMKSSRIKVMGSLNRMSNRKRVINPVKCLLQDNA